MIHFSKFLMHYKSSKENISFNSRSYATLSEPSMNLTTRNEKNLIEILQKSPDPDMRRINILDYPKSELKEEFKNYQLSGYRVSQIFQWIYGRGATSFKEMNNIGKQTRSDLEKYYKIDLGEVTDDNVSSDGTRKWLLHLGNNLNIETVFIPEGQRGTLCVSSQIGCTMNCTFCNTGTQPLVRNLKSGEIVSQVLAAKRNLFDFPNRKDRILTNIVFMGQGEPFYNYLQVKRAIQILTDEEGISISKRRITVSTSGVVPKIRKLGEDFRGINLAISLHAVNDDLRSEIIPANRQWPLAELIEACKNFPSLSNRRRIVFEYVMLKGVNDSPKDAIGLIKLLKSFPSIVNIIPFNPWPGSPYQSSSSETIIEFAKIIEAGGINAPIRWPRGRDILAACGQLKTASENRKLDLLSKN